MISRTKLSLLSIAVSSIFTINANAVDIVKLTGNGINTNSSLLYGNSTHSVQFNQGIEFKAVKAIKIGKHKTKYRMQQYYNGVPIFGYSVVSDTPKTNNYNSFIGLAVNNLNQDSNNTTPKITAKQALELSMPKDVTLEENAISNPQAKLFIYIDKNNQQHLSYLTNYYREGTATLQATRPYHFIDAITSKVLDSWDGLTTDEIGTGPGGNEKTGQYQYGQDFGKIDITKKGDTCYEDSKNVETINLHHWDFLGLFHRKPTKFDCPGDGNANNPGKKYHGAYSVVNDAQYFGNVIFNMYKDWFGISPLTIKLVMRVHYKWRYENAQWNGRNMTFGDGKDIFYPLVALDVTAHEISHGFTEQNSGLVYKDQSGGMNEAFSDMAGEAAKYYKNKGYNDWKVGANIIKDPNPDKALRYFADPAKDGKSIGSVKDFKKGMNVHYSSGVYNKAFYTLANIGGWNTKKAFVTFARANQLYWNPTSDFQDGACGVMNAAKDLGYSTDDVREAFEAVDIINLCE